jgi:hypothetical protein
VNLHPGHNQFPRPTWIPGAITHLASGDGELFGVQEYKNAGACQIPWLTLVSLATWETEMGRIAVLSPSMEKIKFMRHPFQWETWCGSTCLPSQLWREAEDRRIGIQILSG